MDHGWGGRVSQILALLLLEYLVHLLIFLVHVEFRVGNVSIKELTCPISLEIYIWFVIDILAH